MALIQQIAPTMRYMKMLADCRIFVFSNTLKKVSSCVADIITVGKQGNMFSASVLCKASFYIQWTSWEWPDEYVLDLHKCSTLLPTVRAKAAEKRYIALTLAYVASVPVRKKSSQTNFHKLAARTAMPASQVTLTLSKMYTCCLAYICSRAKCCLKPYRVLANNDTQRNINITLDTS